MQKYDKKKNETSKLLNYILHLLNNLSHQSFVSY